MSRPPMKRASWPTSVSRPLVTPLQPSVVYAADDPDSLDAQYEGVTQGYTYAREGHPNADVLAGLIDGMEGAAGGLIVGSGMAAVTVAILGELRTGDHIVGADQLYGRSLRLMSDELPRLGIETSFADPTDVAAFEVALRPNTKMILLETVANPTLRVADLTGVIALAKARSIIVVVDNTFTTPKLMRPFELGADVIVHSVTKMLAGHSDATLGYVVSKSPEMNDRMAALAATMGMTPSPYDCWMAERGLYSFDMRFDRASATAEALSEALSQQATVKRVLYPNRADHPDHNRAISLMPEGAGNMVSFELTGGREAANTFVRALKGIAFAPTLGDIATTVSHPASSSHRGLSEDGRLALGISQGFFRVSVGCEDPERLIEAFKAALG